MGIEAILLGTAQDGGVPQTGCYCAHCEPARSDLALRRSEHKRWQMGVVLKVSPKAFGSGRMIPITRR